MDIFCSLFSFIRTVNIYYISNANRILHSAGSSIGSPELLLSYRSFFSFSIVKLNYSFLFIHFLGTVPNQVFRYFLIQMKWFQVLSLSMKFRFVLKRQTTDKSLRKSSHMSHDRTDFHSPGFDELLMQKLIYRVSQPLWLQSALQVISGKLIVWRLDEIN